MHSAFSILCFVKSLQGKCGQGVNRESASLICKWVPKADVSWETQLWELIIGVCLPLNIWLNVFLTRKVEDTLLNHKQTMGQLL